MKNEIESLKQLFEGKTRYVVDPSYRYMTTSEHWDAFWQSVLRFSGNPWKELHFLGKLDLLEVPLDSCGAATYLITQGEDNFVISQIFLYALYDEGLRRGLDTLSFISPLGMYLMQSQEKELCVPKLKLESDNEALNDIASGKMRENRGEPFTALAHCYKFFQSKLRMYPGDLMAMKEAVCATFVFDLDVREANKPFMLSGFKRAIYLIMGVN